MFTFTLHDLNVLDTRSNDINAEFDCLGWFTLERIKIIIILHTFFLFMAVAKQQQCMDGALSNLLLLF